MGGNYLTLTVNTDETDFDHSTYMDWELDDRKAKNVFAKSLTRFGAVKVVALGIVMAGDPLVVKKTEFKKTSTQIASLPSCIWPLTML